MGVRNWRFQKGTKETVREQHHHTETRVEQLSPEALNLIEMMGTRLVEQEKRIQQLLQTAEDARRQAMEATNRVEIVSKVIVDLADATAGMRKTA